MQLSETAATMQFTPFAFLKFKDLLAIENKLAVVIRDGDGAVDVSRLLSCRWSVLLAFLQYVNLSR